MGYRGWPAAQQAFPSWQRSSAVRTPMQRAALLARQPVRDVAPLVEDGFDALFALLEALGGAEQPRMRDYLRAAGGLESLGYDPEA